MGYAAFFSSSTGGLSGRLGFLAMVSAVALLVSVGCGEDYVDGFPGTTGGAGGTASTSSGTGGDGLNATTTTSTGGTGAGSTGTAGHGGAAGGGNGGGGPCHPTGLQDDFQSGVIGPLWGSYGEPSTMGVQNGKVFFPPQPLKPNNYSGLYTHKKYDVLNCSVWIEVAKTLKPNTPGGCYLELWKDEGNSLQIGTWQNVIVFRSVLNHQDAAYAEVAHSGEQHRWWRFRESAGTTYFDTSTDGWGWNIHLHTPTASFLIEITVGFGAGTSQASLDAGRAEFDNVNVLP